MSSSNFNERADKVMEVVKNFVIEKMKGGQSNSVCVSKCNLRNYQYNHDGITGEVEVSGKMQVDFIGGSIQLDFKIVGSEPFKELNKALSVL